MGWFRSLLASLGLANDLPPMAFSRDDPDMQEAARLARENFQQFADRLRDPKPGDENFLVKIPLPLPGNSIETVWASEPRMDDDGRWTAQIENVPAARGYREGGRIAFEPATIADWCYFSGAGLQGGFSQRVMIERLPERQRAQMRARLGIMDS
jgi:uncharacterized protein YegJ (DUF2314 family)